MASYLLRLAISWWKFWCKHCDWWLYAINAWVHKEKKVQCQYHNRILLVVILKARWCSCPSLDVICMIVVLCNLDIDIVYFTLLLLYSILYSCLPMCCMMKFCY